MDDLYTLLEQFLAGVERLDLDGKLADLADDLAIDLGRIVGLTGQLSADLETANA